MLRSPIRIVLAGLGCLTIFGLFGVLVLILVDFSLEKTTAKREDTNNTETTSSAVLFEDDFSSTSKGWTTAHDSTRTFEYTNGGYRMYNLADEGAFVSPASISDDKVTDASIEVDATRNDNTGESGGWGVVCRWDPREQNGYLLGLTDNGLPIIVKSMGGPDSEEGGLIAVGNPNDVESPASNHRIRADCVGSKLALYVDGHVLIDGSDDELSSGRVGLFVDHGQDVTFDNFSASEP
jgi:hypothetical protein